MKNIKLYKVFASIFSTVIFCTVLMPVSVFAKGKSAPKEIEIPSYEINMVKKHIEDGNNYEAAQILDSYLESHPNSYLAYIYYSALYRKIKNPLQSLYLIEEAQKYVPVADTTQFDNVFYYRTRLYEIIGDTTKALEVVNEGLQSRPNSVILLPLRAFILANTNRISEAYKDLEKLESINPTNQEVMLVRHEILKKEGKTKDAYKQLNKLIKYWRTSIDDFLEMKADMYFDEGKYSKCLDVYIDLFSQNPRNISYFLNIRKILLNGDEALLRQAVAMLEAQKLYTPTLDVSDIIITLTQDYDDEVTMKYLKKSIDDGEYSEADTYSEELMKHGKVTEFLDFVNFLKNKDVEYESTTDNVILHCLAGEYEKALDLLDSFVVTNRTEKIYQIRGKVKQVLGDTSGALRDYDVVMMLNPSNYLIMLSRAQLCYQMGQKERGDKEIKKYITQGEKYYYEYDNSTYYLPVAYYYIGEKEKAEKEMQKELAKIGKNPHYAYTIYNAAANYYALKGDLETAREYVKKFFESGYGKQVFIGMNYEIDRVGITKEDWYRKLEDDYHKQIIAQRDSWKPKTLNKDAEVKTTKVPFTNVGGVTEVECTVNGLPLKFIFDTGASDVTISSVEATFMLKNGYLNNSDVTGTAYYGIADGSVSAGMTINLRKVEFGGFTLENVKASVVDSQRAPLLLGQTVLNKLGKVEVDYNEKVLRISQSK